MDRFEAIATFLRVVETGGVSAAAAQEGLAKSVVSRRIAALEERLGAPLFRRQPRGLQPTETGRAFYERCRQAVSDLEEAEQTVIDAQGALAGNLKISVPATFGLHHLTPALLDFMAEHPVVTLDIGFDDRRVDLVEEGIDLAIRIARLDDSQLIARRLVPIRHVVCASPAWWDRHGRPDNPDDLARHAFLRYSRASRPDRLDFVAPDGRRGHVSLTVAATASNGDFLASAAIAGFGVVVEPSFIVHRAIEDGALEAVLTDHQWSELSAWAVYPPTRRLSRRLRALIDFLAARLGGDRPYWDHWMDEPARS